MINYIKTRGECSDCTTYYDIETNHIKVGDFIKEAISYRLCKYGSIWIDDERYQYKAHQLKQEIPSEKLELTIKKITAWGGWWCMNFEITTL